jgi:cytoskeletal protein CcmA (bactofilin family)
MFPEKNKVVNITTLIGRTCKITGNITTKENIRVDGQVFGNIESDNHASVSESATIDGNIKGAEIFIAGKVVGNLTAYKAMELAKTANIAGDIVTAKLHVHSGAIFNGNTKMGDNIKNVEDNKTPTQKPDWLEKK